MVTVAKDVKAGITFNPEYVWAYRLIGYENKLLTQEEFEDSNTDAGELGSGHTVTVVYELEMTEKALAEGDTVADVIVKYKPTENVSADAATEEEITLRIDTGAYHETLTQTDAFVASVVEFALILRDSAYKADSNIDTLITRLSGLDLADDEFKREFGNLVVKYRDMKENGFFTKSGA